MTLQRSTLLNMKLVLAALLWASPAFCALVDPARLTPFERAALEDADVDPARLTEERYALLKGPFDWRKEELSDAERSDLVLDGCRLEDDGRALCLPDKEPITGFQALSRRGRRAARHAAIERVLAVLAKEDPSKPLSPQARGYVRKIDEAHPGLLPDALLQAVSLPGANAGGAAAAFETAYLDSTRFFDGRRSLDDLRESVVPVPAPPSRGPQAFYDDAESRASAALTQSMAEELNKNPVGRELAKSLGGVLPPIVVLPIQAGAEAFYHGGRVVLSEGSVLDQLAEGLDGKRAAALKARLSKPGALAAHLSSDAAARAKVLAANEGTIVHEMTHGLQERRDVFNAEQDRGNVLSANYAEEEHEAFLTELRYLHADLLADPDGSMSDEDLSRYESLVSDFDRFRDEITRSYAETFPDGAGTLKTAREVAALRAEASQKLMRGGGWTQTLRQALKLAGLATGAAETDAYEQAYAGRMESFRKLEYSALVRQSPLVLARAWKAKAARETDRLGRVHALETALEHALRSGDQALVAELRERVDRGRRAR